MPFGRAHIPNLLSLSRIAAAAVFPFLPADWRLPAILWALVSEFLDGFLARRWHAITPLGQLLDPIGDKLFILATIAVLIVERRLSWFDFSLIAMRDIVVAMGSVSVLVETTRERRLPLLPRVSGKITTGFQFALLVCLFGIPELSRSMFVATAIASSLSAIDYLYYVLHQRFDYAAPAATPDINNESLDR